MCDCGNERCTGLTCGKLKCPCGKRAIGWNAYGNFCCDEHYPRARVIVMSSAVGTVLVGGKEIELRSPIVAIKYVPDLDAGR